MSENKFLMVPLRSVIVIVNLFEIYIYTALVLLLFLTYLKCIFVLRALAIESTSMDARTKLVNCFKARKIVFIWPR